MNTTKFPVRVTAVFIATALLAACAHGDAAQDKPTQHKPAATLAAGEPQPARELELQRVVMLMRHGVRPPTKETVAPEALHDKPWPKWSAGFGELTAHGYDAARLLGQWDRGNWAQRGLLPATGCPGGKDVEIAASSKSRTQATARALVEGMLPGCKVHVQFPASSKEDVEFHPLDAGTVPIDADEAMRAVSALAPPGGMQAEIAAHAQQFELLNMALGCTPARKAAGCDVSALPTGLVRNEGDRPDVGDPFGIASTISQTFLLEYLEGMPMADVAWGRLNRQQIEDLLQFHSLKFYYEGRAPYVAARAASPLASRMLEAMQRGPKLTVLVGHDTNIADLGGFLDLHWKVPSYPRDDPPPGGALGFEVSSNAEGHQFVRAFYRSQTMDQVRELQPLSAGNAPSYEYLSIPGCDSLCPMATFVDIVGSRLIKPQPR